MSQSLSRRDLFKAGFAILAGLAVSKIETVEALIPKEVIPAPVPRCWPLYPATVTPGSSKVMSLVRIAYPNQLAADLCSVQPMTAQTGEIFTLINKYRIPEMDFEIEMIPIKPQVHRAK